ncbi:uncharacterized protein LOC118205522 isoform X2 [Stegodyphus dumicola]|uniref:uncharacterized protein LOC118205522 isoform X2 n=1 Tax=Stegodyphus dumicola TaxID=202533 RepID=UPI0015B2FD5E|nr:uncharacterized protein LOC118205522 isoform X2 [Stegodyphus dumicola]
MFSSSVHSLGEQSTWDSNNVRQLLKIPDDQLKVINNLPGQLPDSDPSLGTSSVSSPTCTATQVISNGLPCKQKVAEKDSNACEHNSNNFENTKHLKSVEEDEIHSTEKNVSLEDQTAASVNIMKDHIVNSQDNTNVMIISENNINSSNDEQGSEAYLKLNDKCGALIDAEVISLSDNLNESSNSQPIPCGQPVKSSNQSQLENKPTAEKNASSQNISNLEMQIKVCTEPSQDYVSHSHKITSPRSLSECSVKKKDQYLPVERGISLNKNLDESSNTQPIPCGQPIIISNQPQLKNELTTIKNASSENVSISDTQIKANVGVSQNCILHSDKINNSFMLSECSDKSGDQNLEAKQKRLGRKRKMPHDKESKDPQSKIAKKLDIHFTPDQVRNIIDVMKLFFSQ